MNLVLEVKNLKKFINGNLILKNVNMNIFRGEIYGFIGRNGAGKTTTIRTILGLLKPDSGKIKIFGENLKREHFKDIGVMFEYEAFNPEWNLFDSLKETSYIYGIDEERILEVLEFVELDVKDAKKKFKELSKGMKRKASLASALLHDPKFLILDEPTSGLDPEMQLNVRNLLLKLKSQGKTVLFSSHNLYEVQKISDKIGVIKDGETILEISIKEKLFFLEGNYPELKDYKVKSTNIYIFPQNVFDEFGLKSAKELNDIEKLYFTVVGRENEI